MTRRLEKRPGFTLVELLVVAAIMATLFGLVVGGTRQSVDRQVRQAAQLITSALMAAQSRGLGEAGGAFAILESDSTAPARSIAVANAITAPLLTGSATIPVGSGSVLSVQLTPANSDSAELAHAYRIRFGGAIGAGGVVQPLSPWMSVSVPTGSTNPTVAGTVKLRDENNQTLNNTIWPSGTLPFWAVRYPSKGDTVLSLPRLAAIDLRYSGIGEESATIWNGSVRDGWGSLAVKGSIGIGFDTVGRFDTLMQRVTEPAGNRVAQPTKPTEPLYLLVSTREWMEDHPDEPLNNPNSLWVVVHPQTGRTSSAQNVPTVGVNASALRSARAKARANVLGGK